MTTISRPPVSPSSVDVQTSPIVSNDVKPSWKASMLPKQETKAYDFLRDNPTFDGRGVKIGILDTGVDPAATGLRVTSTGERKVIDLIDCAGSGDVDVSKEVELKRDETNDLFVYEVVGITGRTLKLNPKWNIVDGKIFLGVKAAYELYPLKLKKRVLKERMIAYNKEQKKHSVEVRKKLDKVKEELTKAKSTMLEELKKDCRNLEEMLSILKEEECEENFEKIDPGPIFDCVVFNDGSDWCAIIDTNETGDFQGLDYMVDYRKKFDYRTFGTDDVYFTYAINIYDDTKILSIVTDAGAHGSHVAGITSAFHSPESEVNGVAPGAQIIGLKLGDSRLGSMETGTGFTRCIIEAVRRGCDIINMSYGEAVSLCNTGRHNELVRDLVQKYNIVFVASAGNNGPALSTVGAPGASMDDIISVGAFVSRDMMCGSYSLILDELESSEYNAHRDGSTYTWSSVGPSVDGSLGVDIIAPGAAITSVPTWTLQKFQLMNGTSMSSPNLTGCISLLISACKQRGIEYSAQSIRRAIQNTATFIDGMSPLQQGNGMINVQAAWKYLCNKSLEEDHVKFNVLVDSKYRGIYLRSYDIMQTRHSIEINPTWHNSSLERHKERINSEWLITIKSSNNWIKCPNHFVLMHNGRSFNVMVDSRGLDSGVHCGHIEIINEASAALLIRVPVIVVVPHPDTSPTIDLGIQSFRPAEVKHFFLKPPHGATFMVVRINPIGTKDSDLSTQRILVLHTIQLLPHSPYREYQTKRYLQLNRNSRSFVITVPIESQFLVEVCLARYWSVTGDFEISCECEFRGILPNLKSISLISNEAKKIVLTSLLRDEELNVDAKLSTLKSYIKPVELGKISVLGYRDNVFEEHRIIYQIVLKYEFTMAENGQITPRVPMLQGYLYESALESQLLLCFDGKSKLLGVADAWPGQISAKKGKVVIFLQIRHESPTLLEKFSSLEMVVERKLKNPISAKTYFSHENMILGKSSKPVLVKQGSSRAIFIEAEHFSKLPGEVKLGDVLEGTISFCNPSVSKIGQNKRPGGFPLSLVIGKPDVKEKKATPMDEKSLDEKIMDDLVAAKSSILKKHFANEDEKSKFDSIFEEFLRDHPSELSLHLGGLKHFMDDAKAKKETKLFEKVVEACEVALKEINSEELAKHFGISHDKSDPQVEKLCNLLSKKREQFIEILLYRVEALGELCKDDNDDLNQKLAEALKESKRWIKAGNAGTGDANALRVMMVEDRKRLGTMLKYLSVIIDKQPQNIGISGKDCLKEKAKLLEELGYLHLRDIMLTKSIIDFPSSYATF